MPTPQHIGPIIFAGIFVLAAVAMTLFGTLPTHVAIAAKAMMLIYAALLAALAFAPVKGQRPVTDAAKAGNRQSRSMPLAEGHG